MHRMSSLVILTVSWLIIFTLQLNAVPISEEVIQKLKNEGRFEKFKKTVADARSRGVDVPSADALKKSRSTLIAAENVKTLVILIDFPDRRYTAGSVAGSTADFQNLLFSENVISTGSMREYYIENSFGQLYVEGNVAGWYTAPNTSSYYTNNCDGSHGMGTYPNNAQRLVENAVDLADPYVDFSQYDNDGDGYVDGLFVVHAGTGYENTGNDCEIHSHAWGITPRLKDGVWISTYSIEPEESPGAGLIPIGVFCHEFGHVLGLPDLYDYDYDSRGTGRWGVMASGSYNNNSRTPAQFDAWCKYRLGWIDPVVVSANQTGVEIPAAAWNPVAYLIWKNGQAGNEYFMVENKQRQGFDAYLPSQGLLLYHIDDNVYGNDNQWHPQVFIEQADGRFDLQYNANGGDAGDPYPGSLGVTSFNDLTVPSSRAYDGSSSMVAVWNISPSDSVMTADFDVVWSRPYLTLVDSRFSDAAFGDGDFVPEAGETILLQVDLHCEWADAEETEISVSVDDPVITFSQGTAYVGSIASGSTGSNGGQAIVFSVPYYYPPRIDTFIVTITANSGLFETVLPLEQAVGGIRILIVDEDGGTNDFEQYYIDPLYQARRPYLHWDEAAAGHVSASELARYDAVFWFTGSYRANPLVTSDITAMQTYLEGGGNLFLTGQGIAAQLAVDAPTFMSDYLKAQYQSTQMIPAIVPSIAGQVLTGLDTLAIQGYNGASDQTNPDHLLPVNGGISEAAYMNSANSAAVSYSGSYKTIFFSFGFEALGESATRFSKRSEVYDRILDFFGLKTTPYTAGDANADGDVNIGDAVHLIGYAFKGGSAPVPLSAGDANGDCSVDVGDAVYLINFVFKGGADPVAGCM